MIGRVIAIAAFGAALSACTSTDVTLLSQNTILISTDSAPACGRDGARKVAFNQAAAETIRRGYDKFIILNAQSQSHARVIGTTPIYGTVNTTGHIYGNSIYSNSSGQFYGGEPIIANSTEANFAVRLFHSGEAGAESAIDARQQLGPKWPEIVKKAQVTCL